MKHFFKMFLLYIVAFYLVLNLPFFSSIFDIDTVYSDFVASVVSFCLNAAGLANHTSGSFLVFDSRVLHIVFGCSGLESILIFSAAVLAYDAGDRRAKAVGLAVGAAALFALNILRLMLLGYILVHHKEFFILFHEYISQGVFILFSIGAFVLYLFFLPRLRAY